MTEATGPEASEREELKWADGQWINDRNTCRKKLKAIALTSIPFWRKGAVYLEVVFVVCIASSAEVEGTYALKSTERQCSWENNGRDP